MAKFQIGSYQHKRLFCQLLTDTPPLANLKFPQLEDLTRKRLSELQIWPLFYRQIQYSSCIAQSFSESSKGTLLKDAIAQFAQDELVISKAVKSLCEVNHLTESHLSKTNDLPRGEAEFRAMCHQNHMRLFWMSGLYELATRENYLQPEVLSIFDQVLNLQARHVLFFFNWLAFESQVTQKPEYTLTGLLSFWPLKGLWFETFNKLNRSDYDDNLPIHPQELDYFLGKWGYSDFLQACESNYVARFVGYDDRLVHPTTLLNVAKSVRTLLGFWPQRVNAIKAPST